MEPLVADGVLDDLLSDRDHRQYGVQAPAELVEPHGAVELLVPERERSVHTEVVSRPAAAGPEQVGMRVLAGLDHPSVGEHEARGCQPVAGQAEHLVAEADAAAQHQPGDPHRGTAARRHEHAPVLQQRVQIAVGDPSPDGDGPCVMDDRHRPVGPQAGRARQRGGDDALHPGHVQQQARGGGVSGVVVAQPGAGDGGKTHLPSPAERFADVAGGGAGDDSGGLDPGVAVVERDRQRRVTGLPRPVEGGTRGQRVSQPLPVPAADPLRCLGCRTGIGERLQGTQPGSEGTQGACPQHAPPADHCGSPPQEGNHGCLCADQSTGR